MAEEKKKQPCDDSPTFIIAQSEHLPAAAAPSKTSATRKYVIIAISAIVVAAIVLTAILVGMHLFTDAQNDIIKFSYNRDANTKEDVTSDPNSNIVQYHVNYPTYELWVVDDFNKDIQVTKIHSADRGTNCYVAPLNRTIATDPSKVSAPTDPSTMDKNATYYLAYRAADTTIADSSFLSKAARDLCSGISTYWVFPSCVDPDGVTTTQRKKRDWVINWCCFGYCWWIFCAEVCWC